MLIFTKKELAGVNNTGTTSASALSARIHRRIANKELLVLKKGLYLPSYVYLNEPDKITLTEFISSQMCPSYLSLDYILHKNHLLLKSSDTITAISTRSNRVFKNFLGTFRYRNLKELFYFGFERGSFHCHNYYFATKAKALFDYFYLNSSLAYRNKKKLRGQLLEESEIQWAYFSAEDFQQFDKYVWQSNSKKMMRILYVLQEYFQNKNFNVWAKSLLS